MASSQTSTSRATKKPKITIKPPRELFIDLTQEDAKTPSPKHKPISLNEPNAPFKTPSTRGVTSSSLIASKLNSSLFYSASPSINPYLSSNNSPPPRVSHPIPSLEHQPMDITLTLSPITPLDFALNTSSPPLIPSPPIVAHPISFNLFMTTKQLAYLEDVSTISVWVKLHGVPVMAFSEDSLSAIATKLVMIELRADVELKDNIVVAMPKITREGHYTCNVRVEYEWKPSRCLSCKGFGHIHEECSKNTGAGEKKTVKRPSQASRGVPKKSVEPTIEVSNSNPFDVLNSIDNDVEFGTNGGTSNLGNIEATPSGSSFMNIDNDGELASNTPIGIVESDSEVDVVYDETANLMIPTSGNDRSDKGYGTNSLLEQWMHSYPDNDDYDPYDDDMYENHDLSEHLQFICEEIIFLMFVESIVI
ncbi:hypothetical protein Tco_1133533 [Tanacetum coccineum]